LYPKEFCGLQKLGPLTFALSALIMDAATPFRVVWRIQADQKCPEPLAHFQNSKKNR
jgi:hypothetical protein